MKILVVDLTKIRSNLNKLYRHLQNILDMRYEISQPISLVIDLTGKCDWNCDFCYIKNRDKTIELDYKKLINFIDVIKPMSVELTGGEPVLYSKINELVLYLFAQRIKIGMFTNGQQFWRLHYPNLLSWVRVSINRYIDEDKEFTDPPYPKKLGYSYIVHEHSPHDWKERISNFANTHRGDYVKITSDINRQTNIDMWRIYTMKAVVQKPVEFKHYHGKCYMGFLKPYLNHDGLVYACVGNVKDYKRDKSKAITDINRPQDLLSYHIIHDLDFDCYYCRFSDRNEFIDYVLQDKVEDEEFI